MAGYRHWKLDTFEVRAGLSFQVERAYPQGADVQIKRALAPVIATTWRRVDNVYDPSRGGVLALQLAAGTKSLGSGDDTQSVIALGARMVATTTMPSASRRRGAGGHLIALRPRAYERRP